MKKARPISPHLSIYKMQITSALSIMHRVSGMLLFIGFSILLWWLSYCVHNYGYNSVKMVYSARLNMDLRNDFIFSIFSSCMGKFALIIWSYCLFYHMFAGIRHLAWDMGLGFKLSQTNLSGWVVVIFSLLVWLGVWIVLLT